jgi:hypothetical protein
MKAKTISFSDLWAFRECPFCYLERIRRKRKPPANIYEAVGEAAHAAIVAPEEEREAIIEKYISQLPEEQQEQAGKMICEHIRANARLVQQDESINRKPEKQLSWFFESIGWILKAKPDEIGYYTDSRGAKVLQITELKTASFLKAKHKEQLYFFGLVASLALGHRGPIKLVLRLLGSETEQVFWYSHFSTERSLAKVRSLIGEIETFLANPSEYGVGEHGLQCCCRNQLTQTAA